MVELYSNILEHKSEVLEETNVTERTYGTGDVEGGDIEGGNAEDEDVGNERRIRLTRTLFVERQPGDRDWAGKISPTSNGLKVRGTSTPNFLSPNGRPAENNKWKRPLQINPTSPG